MICFTRFWRLSAIAAALGCFLLGPAHRVAGEILIEEDFTDGAFDGINAGEGGEHWHLFGGGDVGFKVPNNRSGFNQALARRSAGGGSSWAGAKWRVVKDGEARLFGIEKNKQLLYVEFSCFSDMARASTEQYGVEVAMLEEVDEESYQGDPHYGHDLSFEVKQAFSTASHDYQLETNVENDFHRGEACVKSAHYQGGTTKGELNKVFHNLVVLEPKSGSTQIRQWSTRFDGCSFSGNAMTSQLNPNSPTANFNLIQITLFRQGVKSSDLIRDGVSVDKAQIGILRVKVGIMDASEFRVENGRVVDSQPMEIGGPTRVAFANATGPSLSPMRNGQGAAISFLSPYESNAAGSRSSVMYSIDGSRIGTHAGRSSQTKQGPAAAGIYIIKPLIGE